MPVYDYDCRGCGTFSTFRPLAESSAPAHCPTCGDLAAKLFPVVHLQSMRPENRRAWERNERSAHAPHACGPGCNQHRSAKPKESRTKKSRFSSSRKPNSRPWMLGH